MKNIYSNRPNGSLVLVATALGVLAAAGMGAIGWIPHLNVILLIPFVLGLFALTVVKDTKKVLLACALIATSLIGFFMAIYRPVDFNYPLVWNPGVLFEGGQPFSLFVNISKAMGGYLVFLWLCFWNRIADDATRPGMSLWRQCIAVAAGAASILLVANLFFGVDYHPKLPNGLIYFAIVNLLTAAAAEEAFFRLLLQSQIERFFKTKWLGVCVSAVVSAVIFALAHSGPAEVVFWLFLFAGAVYAAVYALTRSILTCISTHFCVNMGHILLLQYPL